MTGRLSKALLAGGLVVALAVVMTAQGGGGVTPTSSRLAIIPWVLSKLGIATTSTDAEIIRNTTAATVGIPVQMSPRTKWCGTAWNSVGAVSETNCMFLELLPVTAAGTTSATFKIGYINPAGSVTYPATLSSAGVFGLGPSADAFFYRSGTKAVTIAADSSAGNLNLINYNALDHTFTGTIHVPAGANFYWGGRTLFGATADKLLQVLDNGGTTGREFNGGTPALGTCTGGSLTSGSHNFAGEITGNTSSSCIVNFGTPNFTNTPICFAMSRTSTTHPRISAASASSITITGGVSGEAIGYHCEGRIGT